MMFLLDSAFALECMALVAGVFLLEWLKKSEIKCKFPKFVAIFVIVVSFLGMACTFYYGYEYRRASLFDSEKMMQMHGMPCNMGMMKEKCPMMEKMMMKRGGESQPMSDSNSH